MKEKMLSYSMVVTLSGNPTDHTFKYDNVIGDFKNPDQPEFYLIVFEDGRQSNLVTSKIISIEYNTEYAKCLDFWKQQQQQQQQQQQEGN